MSEETINQGMTAEQALRKIRAENRTKFESIRSYGAGLDPASIVMMRLDTLLNLILSPEQREQFELKFEESMTLALDETLKQVRQASLVQGVSPDMVPLLGPDGRPFG